MFILKAIKAAGMILIYKPVAYIARSWHIAISSNQFIQLQTKEQQPGHCSLSAAARRQAP